MSAVKDRPELETMLSELRSGDTIIVWKLDRLGRSLKHLVDLVAIFNKRNVDFVSLSDSINTTTPQGRLVFNLFASFAEFERELITERTRAGIAAMKLQNPGGGRVRGLSKDNLTKVALVKSMSQRGEMKPADIYKSLGIGKTTFYRYLQMENISQK